MTGANSHYAETDFCCETLAMDVQTTHADHNHSRSRRERLAPDGCPFSNLDLADGPPSWPPSDHLYVNLRGVVFQISCSSLRTLPYTRLAKLAVKCETNSHDRTHYFDRNPEYFHSILDTYSKGMVHVPQNACVRDFRSELNFWNIPETMIAPCCLGTLIETDMDLEAMRAVQREMCYGLEEFEAKARLATGRERLRLIVWLSLEDPNRNMGGKVSFFQKSYIVVSRTIALKY